MPNTSAKLIHNWSDLKQFGIGYLTGEADAFGLRILCDLTWKGKQNMMAYFGLMSECFPANMNSYVGEDKAEASVMISYSDFKNLATFLLFRENYEVVLHHHVTGHISGVSKEKYQYYLDAVGLEFMGDECTVLFHPSINNPSQPRQGDRNVHAFTGRTL